MFTNTEIKLANKAYNKVNLENIDNSIYQYIKNNFNPIKSPFILDYGSGFFPKEGLSLKEKGFNITFYEIGENFVENIHSKKALLSKYDIVIASNVLNTQSSKTMLKLSLSLIADTLTPSSIALVNFPNTPNLTGIKEKEFEELLKKFFNVNILKNKIYKLQLK